MISIIHDRGGHILCCCRQRFQRCGEQFAPQIEASRVVSHANFQLSQQYAVAHGQLFSRHDVLLSELDKNVVWWLSISAECICMPIAWSVPLTVVVSHMQALCSRSLTEADTGNVEVGEVRPDGGPTTFTSVSVAMLRPTLAADQLAYHALDSVADMGRSKCLLPPVLADFLAKHRPKYGQLFKNIWSCNAAFQMASSVMH